MNQSQCQAGEFVPDPITGLPGKVLTVEGSGADARAQINFPRHGTKWLALSVAKLTPVE